MTADGRFSPDTVETLSKRSALLCSNPDCGALTSGPTTEDARSINIGEAAHIYGRTRTSARYKANLTIVELSDITNGIWLCRNCHKTIDNDPPRFPAELLFHWRRQHEQAVLERLGRPGDRLREKLQREKLQVFDRKSVLAQQIVIDRPSYWEYKLTAELLRTDLDAIHDRWRQLTLGMYVRKSNIVPTDNLANWVSVKFHDASKIVGSLSPLIEELNKAWGPPGVAGNENHILTVCSLIASAANNLLEWEEDIRFSYVPEEFQEVLSSMQGVAGHQLNEIMRIPQELSKIFEVENPTGTHPINLVFSMPKNFEANFNAALERATKAFIATR